jgi:hypothetical protein
LKIASKLSVRQLSPVTMFQSNTASEVARATSWKRCSLSSSRCWSRSRSLDVERQHQPRRARRGIDVGRVHRDVEDLAVAAHVAPDPSPARPPGCRARHRHRLGDILGRADVGQRHRLNSSGV